MESENKMPENKGLGDKKPENKGLESKRLKRELFTVEKMIGIYCRRVHHTRGGRCPECEKLYAYAGERIARCKFGADKPACAKCPIHCYKPEMKEAIKKVMRYAGPRMLTRHPVLAWHHLIDSKRKP